MKERWRRCRRVALILPTLCALAFGPSARLWAFNIPWDSGHNVSDPEHDPPPPDEPQCDECQPVCAISHGSPVQIDTGALTVVQEDFRLPTPGLDLFLMRGYNNQDRYNGPLGFGWVSNLTMQLFEVEDGTNRYVVIRRPDGRVAQFRRNADGSYTPLKVLMHDTLVRNPDGSFTLNKNCAQCAVSGAPEERYNAQGRLTSIVDRNNNRLDFTYNPQGRLTLVSHSNGRVVTFTYGANQKIASAGQHDALRV